MNLDEKTLQELKDGKIQFEDLDEKYFYDDWEFNTDTVLVLLNKAVCNFKHIADKVISIREIGNFLSNDDLFKILIERDLLTAEDIKYLLSKIEDGWRDLPAFYRNTILLQYALKNNIISFQEIVDDPDLRELRKDSLDRFSSLITLENLLLDYETSFDELIKNNVLTHEDLRYLLNSIVDMSELEALCQNTSLIKHILKELLLVDNKLAKKFSSLLKDGLYQDNDNYNTKFLKFKTIFDLIEFFATHEYGEFSDYDEDDNLAKYQGYIEVESYKDIDKEVLNLNDFNRYAQNSELSVKQKSFFYEVLKNNNLGPSNLKVLKELVDKIEIKEQLMKFNQNSLLLRYVVDNDIISFQELVDKYASIRDEDEQQNKSNSSCLKYLLYNLIHSEYHEHWSFEYQDSLVFGYWIKNDKLTNDDLRYLLDKIETFYELHSLFKNTSLTEKIFNEFVLDKKNVNKFNTIIENYWWCKDHKLQTVFDWIEFENRNSFPCISSKVIEMNKYVCTFDLTKAQGLELSEVLKDNEVAKNRLKYIIDNQLESNYDFESLMRYLNKKEKKSLLNI